MDELNLQSKFLKGIIGKIISSAVKKKLGGFDVVVDINSLQVKVDDSKVYISASIDANANKEIIPHLVKGIL